jgi:hypothetical protein
MTEHERGIATRALTIIAIAVAFLVMLAVYIATGGVGRR